MESEGIIPSPLESVAEITVLGKTKVSPGAGWIFYIEARAVTVAGIFDAVAPPRAATYPALKTVSCI